MERVKPHCSLILQRPRTGRFPGGFTFLFAFQPRLFQGGAMNQPLALIIYERLLPGSQLLNRLQDLSYRVQVVTNVDSLVECAEQSKPMLVLADLESTRFNVCAAIARLKQTPITQHLPVIAFGGDNSPDLQAAARAAGVALVVGETAILQHLPQLLEQALQVE